MKKTLAARLEAQERILQKGRCLLWEYRPAADSLILFGPAAEIFGFDPDTRATLLECLEPSDRPALDALLCPSRLANAEANLTTRLVSYGGRARYLLWHATASLDGEGSLVATSGTVIELPQDTIWPSRSTSTTAKFAEALDASGVFCWEWDLSSQTRMTLGPSEQMLGSEIHSIDQALKMIHPDDRDRVEATIRESIESGTDYTNEFRFMRPDGEARWFRSRGMPLRSPGATHVSRLIGATCDITELKRTQLELSEVTQRLRLALSTAGINTWTIDLVDGAYMGGMFDRDMYGEQLHSRKRLIEFVHPQDREAVWSFLCGANFPPDRPVSLDYRVRHPDGHWRWHAGHAQLMNGGAAGLLVGISKDITDRKLDAIELADAKAQLDDVLSQHNIGLWTWNRNDGFIARYGACSTLFGRSQASGEEFMNMIHPSDRERVAERFTDTLKRRVDYFDEYRVRDPNGGVAWLESYGLFGINELNGEFVFRGIVADITERKRTEQILELQDHWKELAVEKADLTLWEVDISSGKRRGGALDESLYGFTPEREEEVNALTPSTDREEVERKWRLCIESGQEFRVEHRIRRPDGGERWISRIGRAFPEGQPKPVFIAGVTMDITARKKSEFELRSALELARRASEAKSAFLATTSHEIRTPLNSVVGFAGLMMNTALDETQRYYARMLRASSQQLLALISDVLDFSRIEAGELPLQSTLFEIQSCIESCLELVAPQVQERELCLTMVCRGDMHRRVYGDATRLRQIVINLLSNAIKFTEKGSIRVDCSLAGTQRRTTLTIDVIDSGIGMSRQVLQRLFEPFRQGDPSTTRRYAGTGLGLSICQRLCRLMGGDIVAHSEPQRGSRFTVKLPFECDTTNVQEKTRYPLVVAHCVVSDDVRQALSEQLEYFGADVVRIAPGALGRELADLDRKLAAVIVGPRTLPELEAVRPWPHSNLGGVALPVITLSPLIESPQAEIGPHGELRTSISQILRPSELDRALVQISANTTNAAQVDAPGSEADEASDPYLFDVLIAEDNPVNQILLQSQVELLGYQVDAVSSGHDALAAMKKRPYSIILLDIEMPDMDGVEVARLIRNGAYSGDKRPYIVAVTAHVLSDSRARYLAAGMDDYVSKPVLLDALQTALLRAKRSFSAQH